MHTRICYNLVFIHMYVSQVACKAGEKEKAEKVVHDVLKSSVGDEELLVEFCRVACLDARECGYTDIAR